MRTLMLILSCFATAANAAPIELADSGRLLDSFGTAVTGTQTLRFTLYNGAGTPVWTRPYVYELNDGYYTVVLGGAGDDAMSTVLDSGLLDAGSELGIRVGTAAEMSPRSPLVHVPFAAQAMSVPTASAASPSCTGDGSIRWRTDIAVLEVCNGGSWTAITGGGEPEESTFAGSEVARVNFANGLARVRLSEVGSGLVAAYYWDLSGPNGSRGYLSIYDSNGGLVAGPILANSTGIPDGLGITRLANGNVLVANEQAREFATFDASGVQQLPYTSTGNLGGQGLGVTTFGNGNVLIVGESGAFIVVDPVTGDQVTNGTIDLGSGGGSGSVVHALTTDTGDALVSIATEDFRGDSAKYTARISPLGLVTPLGSPVGNTSFNGDHRLAKFGDGTFALLGADGTFDHLDASGATLSVGLPFDDSSTSGLAATTVAGGNIYVAYSNGVTDGQRIIDNATLTAGAESEFDPDNDANNNVGTTDAVTLSDGTTVLAYRVHVTSVGTLLFLR